MVKKRFVKTFLHKYMLLAVYFVYTHAVLQYLSFSVHIMCKRGWEHRSFVLLRTTWWYSAKELHVGPFRSANITDLQPESKPIIGFPADHLSSRWRRVHRTCLERPFFTLHKQEGKSGWWDLCHFTAAPHLSAFAWGGYNNCCARTPADHIVARVDPHLSANTGFFTTR